MEQAINKQEVAAVTFNRVQTGIFDVYADGVRTDYQVVNGSMGASGRGMNIYCVARNGDLVKALGPLRTAKMFAEARVRKEMGR